MCWRIEASMMRGCVLTAVGSTVRVAAAVRGDACRLAGCVVAMLWLWLWPGDRRGSAGGACEHYGEAQVGEHFGERSRRWHDGYAVPPPPPPPHTHPCTHTTNAHTLWPPRTCITIRQVYAGAHPFGTGTSTHHLGAALNCAAVHRWMRMQVRALCSGLSVHGPLIRASHRRRCAVGCGGDDAQDTERRKCGHECVGVECGKRQWIDYARWGFRWVVAAGRRRRS